MGHASHAIHGWEIDMHAWMTSTEYNRITYATLNTLDSLDKLELQMHPAPIMCHPVKT